MCPVVFARRWRIECTPPILVHVCSEDSWLKVNMDLRCGDYYIASHNRNMNPSSIIITVYLIFLVANKLHFDLFNLILVTMLEKETVLSSRCPPHEPSIRSHIPRHRLPCLLIK